MRTSRLAMLAGAVLLALPALAACGGSASSGDSAQAGPVGGPGLVANWTLTSASDAAILPSLGITLEFTDTDASGFGGVNRYMTTFTSSPEGALDFAEIASTMMAGPDDAMAAEQAYTAALGTVTGYTVAGDELDLFVDETQVLTFSKG
ncbi:MAG: META domain-containing protein [Actinomycetota bacterium]|nr:META domain-containing protein [Actinomycetota bacterium]